MIERYFILATAGHVDHGKSALVKALTGTDPDRLPEEKARGITIDLGFAHLELPSTLNPQPSTFQLGIIDVPGHEDFVKNMVAGVGSIDLALFVVAADDGWMPQTEEHLQILSYLDVSHAVVALTKIDLTEDEGAVEAQLSVQRGDMITLPERGGPSKAMDVVFERSSRPMASQTGAARLLKDGTLVRIHIGSTNVPAHVFFLQTRQLRAGERALAELRLAFPVFAFAGDRFIVRDWSEQTTLGGGVVLDPDACSKRFRTEPQRQLLERRAQSPNDATAFVQSQLERDGAVPGSGLLVKSRFSAAEISRAIALLAAEGKAIAIGQLVADGEKWRALLQVAMGAPFAAHLARPLRSV